MAPTNTVTDSAIRLDFYIHDIESRTKSRLWPWTSQVKVMSYEGPYTTGRCLVMKTFVKRLQA